MFQRCFPFFQGLFQLAEDFQKRGQDLIFINVHRKVERFGLKMNKHLKICRDKTEVMEKLLGKFRYMYMFTQAISFSHYRYELRQTINVPKKIINKRSIK